LNPFAAPLDVVNALYADFLERGLRHFFPDHRLEILGRARENSPALAFHYATNGGLELEWCGVRYSFRQQSEAFTENELRLIAAVGHVLSARYQGIFAAGSAASTLHLFRGLPEDRFVSAFLDHFPYLENPTASDVVADAIEVLRESSLITYENRRVSTGVLLFGANKDDLHAQPRTPAGALAYTNDLIPIKSFHRLCDGMRTLFLVNRAGLLVDLIDIDEWSAPAASSPLPAPSALRYRGHSLATLPGGHICLVLTPNGEIKIFAEGAQVFSFVEGRWRLTDITEKYLRWQRAIGDEPLAQRLFTTALNLAESRRGGLFVVLDDPAAAAAIVAPGDLADAAIAREPAAPPRTKDQIHYLLRGKPVIDLEPTVLESVARMDGGIVLDRAGSLLAFGAILRTGGAGDAPRTMEGGRTTAAVSASRHGHVLKISEDGLVTYYRSGRAVWEI
jgi:hypothetical protein